MVTRIFIFLQQNNLSNPPTPPASLPPTPPPVARQKLLNGFATTEELASKGAVIVGHDGEQFIATTQNIDKNQCIIIFTMTPMFCLNSHQRAAFSTAAV